LAKKEELLSKNDSYNVKLSKLIFLGLKPKKDKVDKIVNEIINIVFTKFKKEIMKCIGNFDFFDFCKNNQIKNSVLDIKNKYYLNQSLEKDFVNSVSLSYLKDNYKEFKILLEDYLDLTLKYEEVQLLPKVFKFYIISDLINYTHKAYLYGFVKKLIKKYGLEKDYFNIKDSDKEIFLRQNVHTRELERYFNYIDEFLDPIKKQNIIIAFKKDFEDYESFLKEQYKKEIPFYIKDFLYKKLDSY